MELVCACGAKIEAETGEELYQKARLHWQQEDQRLTQAEWSEAYQRLRAARDKNVAGAKTL